MLAGSHVQAGEATVTLTSTNSFGRPFEAALYVDDASFNSGIGEGFGAPRIISIEDLRNETSASVVVPAGTYFVSLGGFEADPRVLLSIGISDFRPSSTDATTTSTSSTPTPAGKQPSTSFVFCSS